MTTVKALEWTQTHETTWAADTIIGWFHIDRRQAPGKDSIFYWKRSGENLKPCDTLEAAKAAAQSDYEARIMAAIEPAPCLAAENERLRAALKAAKEVVDVAAGMTSCRSDDEFVWAAQAKINAALEERT